LRHNTDSVTSDPSLVFLELGAAILGLALLSRMAGRLGLSAIPLYLLAGLAFGNGGLAPLNLSQDFIHLGAEIGVLLLLFMLGLEYTGRELMNYLRVGVPGALLDFVTNFPPGLVAGLIFGWRPVSAVLLGGVTWISSSGVISKVLTELRRMDNPETPAIVSVLVLEDLGMAVYLPILAVLVAEEGSRNVVLPVVVAVVAVAIVLLVAVQLSERISRVAAHQPDEVILLTTFGAVLLVAGAGQRLQVSPAIGAFLVGIAVSGPIAQQSHRLLSPLRDLFAALFFFFFGLQIDPSTLPAALVPAIALGVVTTATKIGTGYWSAKRIGCDRSGCWRAGTALVSRGEFSIVIAGLGAQMQPGLVPLGAAYVLFLAIVGPVLTRAAK
jgi:CPA2 family monovalent cation:H+ antiporter-2